MGQILSSSQCLAAGDAFSGVEGEGSYRDPRQDLEGDFALIDQLHVASAVIACRVGHGDDVVAGRHYLLHLQIITEKWVKSCRNRGQSSRSADHSNRRNPINSSPAA